MNISIACWTKDYSFMMNINKLSSRLNGDYLSVLNKRLISENDQLKKIKEQSTLIITNINEDLAKKDRQISELEALLKASSLNRPAGDTETRWRKSKERDSSECRSLKFEVSQKDEALHFKERSLNDANLELKRLRSEVLNMKEQLNLNEERNLSIQTQLRVKDDTIKRLENKIKTLVDTKSIAIKLQPTDSRSEIRHSLAPISPVKFSPLSGNNFESKTFCQGQNKKLKSKTRKSKIKSQAEKFAGVNYDSLLSMLIWQSQMFEETWAAANNNSYSSPYKPQGRHIKNLSPISSKYLSSF